MNTQSQFKTVASRQKRQCGCNDDASCACSVQCPTDREAAPTLKPRRDDDVDRSAAHGRPSHRHQRECGIYLPEPRDPDEQSQPDAHRNDTRDEHLACAVKLKERPDAEEQETRAKHIIGRDY